MSLQFQRNYQVVYLLGKKQLIDYAKSCVEPGYQYFEDKFGNDLKSALSAFNPAKINELQPSAGDFDDLQVLPFFSRYNCRPKEGTLNLPCCC